MAFPSPTTRLGGRVGIPPAGPGRFVETLKQGAGQFSPFSELIFAELSQHFVDRLPLRHTLVPPRGSPRSAPPTMPEYFVFNLSNTLSLRR
jgi:hypothetical protein